MITLTSCCAVHSQQRQHAVERGHGEDRAGVDGGDGGGGVAGASGRGHYSEGNIVVEW